MPETWQLLRLASPRGPRSGFTFVVAGGVLLCLLLAQTASALAKGRRGRLVERVHVHTLLGRQLGALKDMQHERLELKRVTSGRRAAKGEWRRVLGTLDQLKRRKKSVVRDVKGRRERLRLRLRALYRLVRGSAERPLLDMGGAHLPRDGRDVLLRIIKRDLDELRQLAAELAGIKVAWKAALARRGQALAVMKDLDRRRDAVHARLARAAQRVKGLQYRREVPRGVHGKWDKKAKRLDSRIVALRQLLRREKLSFELWRGKLYRPVPGVILRWFGQAKLRGTHATERSKGIEISALKGWRVRAPGPGRVRFAGPVTGFGNVVIIDHDEGYLSLIGHLDRLLVTVGQRVHKAKSVAFYEGLPGRRRTIYYELRRGGVAIDPAPWIIGGIAERRRWRNSKKGRRVRAATRRAFARQKRRKSNSVTANR